jgi:hypothetical protein
MASWLSQSLGSDVKVWELVEVVDRSLCLESTPMRSNSLLDSPYMDHRHHITTTASDDDALSRRSINASTTPF